MRYTLREGNQGTNPVGFTITLRQGATVIATFTHAQGTLPTSFTLFQQTLTNAQADSITNYNNLELTLVGSCTTGCGNSPSQRERVAVSWVEFAVVTTLSPPVLNSITNVNPTTLQLFWTQPLDTSSVLSYNIERDSGSGFSVVGNVPIGTTTFTDAGLALDTFYSYRIVSVGASGNSIPSNLITKSTTMVLIQSTFARPDSDPTLRWVNGIGAQPCSDLLTFNCVDEVVRDDTDYIQTIGLGDGNTDTQFYTLSNIADPLLNEVSHILRYTLREANQGTNPVGFTITLRQGATVIATFTHAQGSLSTTSFKLFEQKLTTTESDSITDYTMLELTLIGSCTTGCSNSPSSREKVQVSWIEFAVEDNVPTELEVLTVDKTTLLQSWSPPLDVGGSPITGFKLERENCNGSCTGNFNIIIANTGLTTTNVDSLLNQSSLYQYRVSAINAIDTSQPSTPQRGQTSSIDRTILQVTGSTVEPLPTNSFSKINQEKFTAYLELFNPSKEIIDLIDSDIRNSRIPAYKSLLKIDNGTYLQSLELSNATQVYSQQYISDADLATFFANLEQAVRASLPVESVN